MLRTFLRTKLHRVTFTAANRALCRATVVQVDAANQPVAVTTQGGATP